MFASVLDKEAAVRIRQALLGASVAATLVFGAGAGPLGKAPGAPARQLCDASIRAICDRVLTVVLDAAGDVEARIRQF